MLWRLPLAVGLTPLAVGLTLLAAAVNAQDRSGPETPATGGQLLSAEQIFASTCGFCHQAGGRVAGRGPKLAGTDRPDDYLINRIRLGKEGAMPAYGRAFSEAQLRAIVAYIRSLKDDSR
jgi:mono/diheme cytochrome c family protein